jgi:DNA polymerase-3 subunit delta'
MLLTAESVESLLPTIVSRCEVVPLRPLSVSELERALAPIGEVGENANLFAGLSAGRPGYALRLAQDEALLALRESGINDLVNVIGFNLIDRFGFIEKWDKSLRRKFDKLDDRRLECIAVLELWLSFWRDVMLSTYKVREPESNPDRGPEIDALSEGISKGEIVEAIQALERSEEAIRRNANLRLALETLMIELPTLNIELTSV